MTRAVRSALLSVLLMLAVCGAPAIAGGGHQAKARSAPEAAVTRSPASRLWSALVNVFARSGGMMDPDGAHSTPPAAPLTPSTNPPTATIDLGGMMDPDG